MSAARCELCNRPTIHTGTMRCDRCWELESRIRGDLELAEGIVRQFRLRRAYRAMEGYAVAFQQAWPKSEQHPRELELGAWAADLDTQLRHSTWYCTRWAVNPEIVLFHNTGLGSIIQVHVNPRDHISIVVKA